MHFKVLLFVVNCNLYFYSHSHSLQFAIRSVGPAYYILMHKISLLWIPKFRKPNPETGSRDYKFLNLRSRD